MSHCIFCKGAVATCHLRCSPALQHLGWCPSRERSRERIPGAMGQAHSRGCCSKSEQPIDVEQVESQESGLHWPSPPECGEKHEPDSLNEPGSKRGEADPVRDARSFQSDLAVDLTQSTRGSFQGVRLRETMRWAGRVWRYRPSELSMQRRSKLSGLSEQVENFDIFFSHTWVTPGRWKVLSLLFQRGWPAMLVAWTAGVLLACTLCMLDVLPLWSRWQSLTIGFTDDIPIGSWLMVFGGMFAMVGLVSSPYAAGWSDVCFLDVVCINQTDERQLQDGINNIGSFLQASSELHVLWSGPYLPLAS